MIYVENELGNTFLPRDERLVFESSVIGIIPICVLTSDEINIDDDRSNYNVFNMLT
ncbi:hypothetical protein HAX54_051865, partial [Datura stramonium]|nr:hypothetical protein [Datura stramonium]